MADGDGVLEGGVLFAEGFEVDGDAEGGADFVLTAIATADGGRVIVEDVHEGLEKVLHLFGLVDEFGLVLQEGKDGDLDGSNAGLEAHDGADVGLAAVFGEVFFIVGLADEGEDGAVATGGGFDDVWNEALFGFLIEVFEGFAGVLLVLAEVVVAAVCDTFEFLLAEGEIDYDEFISRACASAPSLGHCNTMGTASTMNAMAEALGMSLTGNSAIPAPFRERMAMAYETGRRIVGMVHEDLKPSDILTREAFENAIVVNAAIGGSTNAPPHLQAIARHAGVELNVKDWQTVGFDVPLLVNMQPAGEFLGESFYRAGGVPAVMGELMKAGRVHTGAMTATGKTMGDNLAGWQSQDHVVIRPYDDPLRTNAGFLVLSGNLFDSALMKTSVISADFRERFLNEPGNEGVFEARAVVFEGPEDYHERINDASLGIDERTILFIRGVGCVGYPGSAEVVNMQPPDAILRAGINHLPTVGDGRQSGTSESPSILNASPESVVGGGLAFLQTGDRVRLDLKASTMDALVEPAEWAARKAAWVPPELHHQTPWQEIYRKTVGQLSDGGCLELATAYHKVGRDIPRDNH